MGSPEEQTDRDAWPSRSTVLVLCFGLLMLITAALIPAAIGYFNRDDFCYSITGPITVGNRTAFPINVRNQSRVTQKNVEIWLPKIRPSPELPFAAHRSPLST